MPSYKPGSVYNLVDLKAGLGFLGAGFDDFAPGLVMGSYCVECLTIQPPPTPGAPVDPSGGVACPCVGVLGLLGMVVVLGWRILAR